MCSSDLLPEPFYVIGVVRGASAGHLRHEVAHALFHVVADYRREVRRAIRGVDTRTIRRHLKAMGYAAHVIEDEVHAYLIEPSGRGPERARAFAPLRRALRAIYARYAPPLPPGLLSRA